MKLKPKNKGIYFFTEHGDWGFLSPMYQCRIIIDNIEYKSAEHYYQSMKAKNNDDKSWIRAATNGYEAKKRAHTLVSENKVVKNTVDDKLKIMRRAFLEKFVQNPNIAKKLLATGDALLYENSPHDLFWGMKGENWIGRILMEIREKLSKKEKLV